MIVKCSITTLHARLRVLKLTSKCASSVTSGSNSKPRNQVSVRMKKHTITTFIFNTVLLCLFLGSGNVSYGVEPMVWETNTRAELLKGDVRGVSVTDSGAITRAPLFSQLFSTGQAYVWSSVADGAGNVYLGTGHDGRIYRVGSDGHGAQLYKAQELDVTALALAPDGALFAGTSPDGKVYRITADGHADVYFDPPDKYIWSLAVLPDKSLVVGTGDGGKLYRVSQAGTKPEAALLISTNQTHVISLAVDAQGQIIAGTDPGGLVLRISPEGKAFALFNAPLREIHSLAPAPDGSIYVLGLSEAASSTRPAGPVVSPVPTPAEGTSGAASTSVTITAVEDGSSGSQGQSQPNARSRYDLANARSAVFRILPDGGTDVLWSSTSITAFAVAAAPQGGVLIGTADKGRIYAASNDGRDTLLLQSGEGQISGFVVRGNVVFTTSSNQGKLFRFGPELVTEGSYESTVRDAKLVSTWGRIWWRGTGQVEVQTRAGNGERPDSTWSDWSTPYREPAGDQIKSPRSRYIQWRAVLRASSKAENGPDARMEDICIAYLPRNVAPEVLSILALPPGVALQQVIQVQPDPSIESSGLDPALFGIAPVQAPPRRTYQRGARSLQWQAEDRNGDTLEYSVYYRSVNETTFRLLKEKLRENFITIDSAALTDGRYIFKIVASDAPDNPPGQSLTGERISEPVDIDNTPPAVQIIGEPQVTGDRVHVVFDANDGTGMVKRADVSVDAGPWRPVNPDDGIADSPIERYTFDLPVTGAGEHTVSLRVFDNNGNVGSNRAKFRK
jgi:hypothetical protein